MVQGVIQFQYLGITLEETDSDWVAVQHNISKARMNWQRLGRLL